MATAKESKPPRLGFVKLVKVESEAIVNAGELPNLNSLFEEALLLSAFLQTLQKKKVNHYESG